MSDSDPMKPNRRPTVLAAAALLGLAASLTSVAWAQGAPATAQGRAATVPARTANAPGSPAGATGSRPAEERDSESSAAACPACGVVTAIRESTRRSGPAWKSTISGGGSAGNVGTYQDGRSRVPAPTIGAIGPSGGDSGDSFRRNFGFDVHVVMDDGSRKVVHTESRPALSVGDRVKVAGNQVYLH